MIRITVIAVGKCKESYYREAVAEYAKRLGAYCRFSIVEVPDLPVPENAPVSAAERILEEEGRAVLEKIPDRSFVYAMDIRGQEISSESFAADIDRRMTAGASHLVFLIGGSLGLSKDVLARADRRISFGPVTMPHRLFRVVLTEQIYRAFRIIRKEPYHK